jgi:hypothetical protein
MTPLVKYIPRICQDSGMIEQAELKHYTHLANLNTYYLASDVEAREASYRLVIANILHADERGQGLPFKEAMDAAYRLLAQEEPR